MKVSEDSGSILRPVPTPAAVGMLEPAKTVLVVEDEAIVRRVVVRRLSSLGFTVLEASNGKEALALIKNHVGILHLIITDVIMPEMNGRQLIEKIRADRPDVAVLFMSGYPRDVIADRGILEPGIHFIEKTSVVHGLIPKVQSVLHLPGAA